VFLDWPAVAITRSLLFLKHTTQDRDSARRPELRVSRFGVLFKKGQTDLETKMTKFAATRAGRWDAETDEALIDCMAHGTPDDRQSAFDAFYRRHAEYLFGICYNQANRYKFGFFCEDDIFQATMIKARDHANTFRSSVSADDQKSEHAADLWLSRIAKNVLFDLIRRMPQCVHLDPQFLDGDKDGDKIVDFPEESCDSTDTADMQLLREAIQFALSTREREVMWIESQFFVCRAHQHTGTKDLDEIVSSLGISRENFRQIKLRAHKKIKKYMASRKPVTEAK
jgi:RNA polymerase sigma factor (sigma-70 family)